MRSNARARTRGRDELATRTGERHDDIVEKKISVFVRSFVRSRVAFVRARARVTTTTAREGNERKVPCGGRGHRDAMDVSSSIGLYIDILRGTQMSDRQMHKKQNPQKVPT